MLLAISIILGLALDMALGEPRRWHPLAGFGRLAAYLEKRTNNHFDPINSRLLGATTWILLVVPPALLIFWINPWHNLWWLDAFILYWAIGYRSLNEHSNSISHALESDDLGRARTELSKIVSRDTNTLDQQAIRQATIESNLENGNDAIFAPFFWFVVGGAAGVIIYRLANTLDAMWGYRTTRFNYYGWWAARADDLLNYIPARLVALTYALLGNTRYALNCWYKQAAKCDSPNAGPVMCSGAGALTVQLGGVGFYQGEMRQKPLIGCGSPPEDKDIIRSLNLIALGLIVWATIIVVTALLLHLLAL